MISSLETLVDELSELELEPTADFVISQNFPENKDVEFYQHLFSVLTVVGLNMTNQEDFKIVDNWAIKTAKKIKALISEKHDYIN